MTQSATRRFGPQVQPHLEAGERLVDATFFGSLPASVLEPAAGAPIEGTTASRLLRGTPKRQAGVLCITDRRALFCAVGILRKIKDVRWEVPRDDVVGIDPVDRFVLALRFRDGSMLPLAGGDRDAEAVRSALGAGTA